VTVRSGDIANIRLFNGLTQDELRLIARRLELRAFQTGEIILPRNELARELYIILAGNVRIELQDTAGAALNLTELGAGNVIGERAILTDEPRAADVRALSPVSAARLSRENFEDLLHDCPQLYANLCGILARQLGSWAHRYKREEREHRDVITNVIGWQLLPEFAEFPGSSHWVRSLNSRLLQLGSTRTHVLITGEPGTWKDLAARLIHFNNDTPRPILFLDCASPPPLLYGDTHHMPLIRDEQLLGAAQETALFGHSPGAADPAGRIRRGMFELASGGDMILRNIDCLTREVQDQLNAFMDTGLFRRRGESRQRTAQVRIIATSSEPLDELAEQGTFNRSLYGKLGIETLEMAPLRERKKDIPVIARSLLNTLNAKHHKQVRRISQDALNLLVDHDWPMNGSELYQAISRAVVVCTEEEIQPRHIVLQGRAFGDGRFNLLTIPWIEKIARKPDFPRILRWTTVPMFLLILLYTLVGPAFGNPANLAVWTLWWPSLLLTAFLFARGWCSYCPLEAIGEFVGAKNRVTHEPMAWLITFGPPASLGALVVILLVEQATGMFAWAFATGILLCALLVATVAADVFIGRRGWCKFLCPLGRIVSLVSRISLLEMHSNQNVCASRCRVDDCIKEKGCPMGLHPTEIGNSDHCVLCLNCVRSCPHHSMQLDLRNPSLGLSCQARPGFIDALFSVTLVGVVIAAKGTPQLMEHTREVFARTQWSQTESALALGFVSAFAGLAMASSAGAGRKSWKALFSICGLAYLPLAISGLFMIYFRALIEGGAELVPLVITAAGLDNWLDASVLTPELGTLRLFTYPLICAGALFSWHVLGNLQRQHNLDTADTLGHRLLLIVSTILFICTL